MKAHIKISAIRKIKIRKSIMTFTILSTTVSLPLTAWAIDVDIADFIPAPDNTTIGLLYYQHAERNKIYSSGQRTNTQVKLDSDVGIARLVHYTHLGEYAFAPQVLVPFGSIKAGKDIEGLGTADGIGDVILAAPLWLINNPQSRQYFAIAPYLYLPIGQYDHNQTLNMGENRWKFNLQGGYVQGLSDRWFINLTADVMFFGKNDEYGISAIEMKQKPLFQGQADIQYQISPKTNIFTGFSKTWGGETRVEGVNNNDESEQFKIKIGSSHFITPKTQVLMSLGKDIHVENGFKENARINLRLLHVF